MDKIIIDIDNTLWDLAPVLYGRIRELNPQMPPPDQWDNWDFWKPYIALDQAYKILHSIQVQQEEFPPYDDAAWFLTSLKEREFYIIVASHRHKEALDATARWLRNNDLVHDEIHLSYDKTVLFEECWGIVDDSPETLRKARDAGITRAGLRNPWNEREDHPLFDSLRGILQYLDKQMRGYSPVG
jgi:FMN phosphatase YigB (HAD superfamily)